jgi:hypothetical protein
MVRRLALILLVGCGPSEETLLDELRVISLRSDPAVLQFESETTITATVYSPDDAAADVLIWTCLPVGEGCLEADALGAQRPLSAWTTVSTLVGDEAQHVVPATGPLPPAEVLGGFTVDRVPVWALTCAPGACPLMDAVRADPPVGSEAWVDAAAALRDPFNLIVGLPIANTSLSLRSMPAQGTPEVEASNPLVEVAEPVDETPAGPEGTRTLVFDVQHPGAVMAYPLASFGAFTEREVEVIDGRVSLEWVVPELVEEAEQVRVYVAFEAADGGSAIWRGALAAKP